MEKQARKAPDFLNHAVLYQLFLRPFTPEGTFASAGRLLPHLKKLGVDIIYLCPVNEADGDPDPKFWSPRQIQSGLHNPKNPRSSASSSGRFMRSECASSWILSTFIADRRAR